MAAQIPMVAMIAIFSASEKTAQAGNRLNIWSSNYENKNLFMVKVEPKSLEDDMNQAHIFHLQPKIFYFYCPEVHQRQKGIDTQANRHSGNLTTIRSSSLSNRAAVHYAARQFH